MEQETRERLARAVERHCAEEPNSEIDPETFDALLIACGVIDAIPAVGSRGRFDHTQLRHKARTAVRQELRKRDLDLAFIRVERGAGIFVLRAAMESAVKRLNRAPRDAQRLWMSRIAFMTRTWHSGWSVMAKGLPVARRDAFLRRVYERVVATANEELRDLHFLYSGIGEVDWAGEVRSLLDEPAPKPPRPKRRQLSIVPPATPPRRRRIA